MIDGKLRGKVECPYCKCKLSFESGRAEPFETALRCPNPDCEKLIVITGEIAIVNAKALKVEENQEEKIDVHISLHTEREPSYWRPSPIRMYFDEKANQIRFKPKQP